MSKQVKRYKLNAKQIHLLKLIYKFRFVTSSLMAQYKGISIAGCNYAFKVLEGHELIARHFDKTYKLQGKAARYYLTNKGIKYLRDTQELDEQVLHAMYKNKSVTTSFIDHHITVLGAYLHFRDKYPDTFEVFTRSESRSFEDFPEPSPDLYLRRVRESDTMPNEYFLELHHDNQSFVAKKRLASLVENYEEEWPDDTHPTLLFALADARTEQNFQEHASKVLALAVALILGACSPQVGRMRTLSLVARPVPLSAEMSLPVSA